MTTELPKPGDAFRHYKGGIYRVLTTATREKDLRSVVIYKSLADGIWTRPLDEFIGNIEVNGENVRRFEPQPNHSGFDIVFKQVRETFNEENKKMFWEDIGVRLELRNVSKESIFAVLHSLVPFKSLDYFFLLWPSDQTEGVQPLVDAKLDQFVNLAVLPENLQEKVRSYIPLDRKSDG